MGRRKWTGGLLCPLAVCTASLATLVPLGTQAKEPCTHYENSTYSPDYGSCAGTGPFCEECIYWFGSGFVVGYLYLASNGSCLSDSAEPSSCFTAPSSGAELLAAVPVGLESGGDSGIAPPVLIARSCSEGGGLFNALDPRRRESRSFSVAAAPSSPGSSSLSDPAEAR